MFAFLGFLPEFCIVFCNLLKMMLSICTCESQDSHTLPEKPRHLVADCSSFLSKGNMKGSSSKRNWHSKEAGFQKHLVVNFIKNWAFFFPPSLFKARHLGSVSQFWCGKPYWPVAATDPDQSVPPSGLSIPAGAFCLKTRLNITDTLPQCFPFYMDLILMSLLWYCLMLIFSYFWTWFC